MTTTTTLHWQRIAPGSYQADLPDGRHLDLWRVPGVNPPAWNVCATTPGDWHDDQLVDGAATFADAKALAADALGGRS